MPFDWANVSDSPWFRRMVSALRRELAKGTSQEELALAIALGCVGGFFPILGLTSAVAAIGAFLFRANHVVVQLFNFAMSPIYLFTTFGFVAAGAWAFEDNLHAYSLDGLRALFDAGLGAMLKQGARALGQAVVAWAALAMPIAVTLRWAALLLFARWPVLAGVVGENKPR